MDTRRRAPGLGTLASDVHASASLPGAGAASAVVARLPEGRDALARRITEALEANLARGFLESEEQLRQLTETLDDIVFLTDAALTAVPFINLAYEKVWGRPRDELYRDPMAFMQGVHPDDRERLRETLTGRPGTAYEAEFRVVRPDGAIRWVWVRGFPVSSADGTIGRIAGIAEDTTDRKRVLASHEQLLRGFTHDVKNPLGAADGHLALLGEGIYGPLSPDQLDCIGRARRAIHSALDLVGQMLDLERAQTGSIEVHRESFDLAAVLRDLLDEYASAAAAKQLRLLLHITAPDAKATTVFSDRKRVRQIASNLVSNAVKYTQVGGTCVVTARLVEETAQPPRPAWIAIDVSDNGPGIPREQQHLLFREFTRFSPASAEGSGIGLAISQQIAHALDAKITFDSTLAVGSTFTLWLPRDRRVTPISDAARHLT